MSTSGRPQRLSLGRFFNPARSEPDADLSVDNVQETPSAARTVLETQANDRSLIAGLALEIWRLERRLGRLAEKTGEDTIRPIRESIRRLNDLLLEHQVELREHDGEVYADGHQFEVIHIREESNQLVVVETIQPSVLLEGRVVRQGQVVLGAQQLEKEESE